MTGRPAAPVAAALLAALFPVLPAGAQDAPPERGTVGAALAVRHLDGVKRVLVIGAHPDDEDTALLAALSRGRGVRAAYLSLTRGEGGQNLIGSELGEGLGIVRSGELVAARELDGAEQFFTRAYDFGYSKSAEEAFRHWPRDTLVSDVVWVIRAFRPHVVVSIFSGTPSDGHGQHQAAGIVAREAFDAAGDPGRFPEHLERGARPWTPLKLYHHLWRGRGEADVAVETGRFDPLLGRSHHQLAMEARSQHRSQDMGQAQRAGPRTSRLELLESRVAPAVDTALFAGVDTTLAGLAAGLAPEAAGPFRRAIGAYREAVHAAAGRLAALEPSRAAVPLVSALKALEGAVRALEGTRGPEAERARRVVEEKRRRAEEALLAASSVTLELRAGDDVLVPGQTVEVEFAVWNGGPLPVQIRGLALRGPHATGHVRAGGDRDVPVAPGELREWTRRFRVPDDVRVSEPYYLREPRAGDLYRWPSDPELRARPFGPPLLRGTVTLRLEVTPERPVAGVAGGPATTGAPLVVDVAASGPVRYRGVDKARGEFWRPLLVVPALSVSVAPRVMVWPAGDPGPREITATVETPAAGGRSGELGIEIPPDLTADRGRRSFELAGDGASRTFTFRLSAREDPGGEGGDHAVRAAATGAAGKTYRRGYEIVDHPHIDPVPYFRDASATVRRFPVRIAGDRRIGYVMGSGDEGPEALRQLGADVELLGPEAVESAGFEAYDVIVLGFRAYEVRPDLRAANPRLLEWVRQGGTLVVQYNKYEFPRGGYAPFPVEMSRPHDRVTDESAPVTLLAPDAPVFTTPNRITSDDFRGWVQDLGLYFLSGWDRRYVPLVASHDPGEAPKRGGLVAASVGEGVYVYTGLAFFRQLPAGVPGAYRLFANLVSLTPEAWRRWESGR